MSELSPSVMPPFSGDPLLNRFFLTPEQKSDPEQGKAIIKQIYLQQTANGTDINFFKGRNARWIETLLWAKGSQNIQEFLGYMNVSDANKAYISIDTTQSRLGPQFVGTLVESMSKVRMYPCVKAIDDGSLNEKEQRMFDALFRMHEVQTIADIQEKSGVQVEPSNAYVPDDERAARIYFERQDKLPKEIRFEKMCEYTLDAIHFDRILHRKTIYDQVVLNCSATKIEKVGPKKYTIRRCIPTNLVYNFFMNDSGECEITMIGEFYNLKVKDFRQKFGISPSNPKGLTEEIIFNLAKLSSSQNIGQFNYTWDYNWEYGGDLFRTRPYDDKNVLVFDCEVDFGEDMYYVEKTDSFGNVNIVQKANVPYEQRKKDGTIIKQPVPDNVTINKRQKNTWMRGVYAPYGDTMLYWGAPDIIIPQYTNVYKPLSSYTINIPNNDGEYIPSLFERIMDSIRDYQLAKFKRRQLIAAIEPDGFDIDVESIKNIDLGNGNTISWQEVLRIKNQTGAQLYSSMGVDPNVKEAPPIKAGPQSSNISKVIELTNVMAGIANEIRQLIGVPSYRDGADVGDRTAATLAENQNTSSFNVTDFVANADKEMWEETLYKLCLLYWNDIVKEEPESKDDLINTRFDVKINLKSSDYEKQRLEQDIQRFSQVPDAQGNPSISPKDAMMLRDIGEDNYQLANEYLAYTFDLNRKLAIQNALKLQQQNAMDQANTAQQSAQNAQALQAEKIQADKEMLQFKHTKEMELKLLEGVTGTWAKTGVIDPAWIPVVQQLIPNIGIPVAMENKQMGQAVAVAAQQEQQIAEQQSGQAPEAQQSGQPMLQNGPVQSEPQMQ